MKGLWFLILGAGSLVCGQTIADDVSRVAALDGTAQTQALRSLLSGRADEDGFMDQVFYHEGRLRAPLWEIFSVPQVGDSAMFLVALIAVPDDISRMVRLPAASGPVVFENRWMYGVECAMLEPRSDEEWKFLRAAALNQFEDRWVDAGAIQSLKLIASPRSRKILEEARKENSSRAGMIDGALAYIQSNPTPLEGEDLPALAERVAKAVKIGNWEGNQSPWYNREGDKALVDFSFRLPEDALTFTATFHRVQGVWRLRGVRETHQAFVPPPIPVRKPSF